MATGALVWDDTGKKVYENGVSKGVLYVKNSDGTYQDGVSWNGLTAVNESPDGAEPTDLYADNIKYASLRSAETFGATIEAYTYPDEFATCDGSASITTGVFVGQQPRTPFAFCYRTEVGSDSYAAGSGQHYKIHIVYNATVTPSEKNYETINDSPDAITFSWDVDTVPVNVTGKKPTATVVIDCAKLTEANLTKLENALYGTNAGAGGTPAATAPTLLLPDEIVTLLS